MELASATQNHTDGTESSGGHPCRHVSSMQAMGSVVTGLIEAIGAGEKVFELIDLIPKIDHFSSSHSTKKMEGHVEFKDVWFSYPTRPDIPVLKGVSFSARPGEVIALVGKSHQKSVVLWDLRCEICMCLVQARH